MGSTLIVWEADAATLVRTFVSKQAKRLLGYPLEAWLKPDFLLTHVHPEDRDWALSYVSSCTRLMKPFDLEYRFIAQDGREIWLHDMITVTVENGAPRWLRGITVDITRRRQAEDRLVLLTESLENRVIERTQELRRVSAHLTMLEERERRMLAEDLHDNLSQLLAVIKIKLTSLPDDAAQTSIRQIVELVEQADGAARSITQQLSPPILKTLGLGPALEWLGDEIERLYGLNVHVDFGECTKRLREEVQAVLYRSARELLINVAKHAGVQAASLTCLCDRERLVLVVSDAGKGFEPAEHLGAGHGHGSFGLRSIQERVINLGGDVDIDSNPGNGTTVTLSVPRIIEGKEICDDPNNACR
jgi:PAS domain S-box-containing protein